MSKVIKVIDLLNKIANGKKEPRKIKYKEYEYVFHNMYKGYYRSVVNSNWIGLTTDFSIIDILNKEVEIIEEEPEIDIQGIEELPFDTYEIEWEDVRDTTNELIKAIKQLDNQINNK